MTKYNVIWIDDECEQDKYFVPNAIEKGIKIIGYKSVEEGIEALKATFKKWDGIVLDANCLVHTTDRSPSMKALRYSIKKIEELFQSKRNEIPVFILSGYDNFTKNDDLRDMVDGYEIFDKQSDFNSIYERIIKSVENLNRIETFVRRKYAEILNADPDWETELTNILVVYEKDDYNNFSILTEIRGVLEKMRLPLSKILLINDSEIEITKISKHWENNDTFFNFIPIYVREKFRSLAYVTNGASHYVKSATQNDISEGKAPFLVKNCILDLLTILHWFNKELPISNDDIEKYKSNAKTIIEKEKAGKNLKHTTIKGKVKIIDSEFHLIVKEGLRIGDEGKSFYGRISKFW